MNIYRFAELSEGESLVSPDTCSCCGREGLKKTVKMIDPSGVVVWFGTSCAAKASGKTATEIRQGRKFQRKIAKLSESQDRSRKAQEDFESWTDFLTRTAGPGEVSVQIEKLGGFAAARKLFQNS